MEKYLPGPNEENDDDLPGIGGVYNTLNLAVYGYVGQNPLRNVDPDGKELVRVVFLGESAFTGKRLIVDKTFVPAVIAMNQIALERGIKIDVTSATRSPETPLSNTVVERATNSKHDIGRGLDVNLIDKDGRRHNASRLRAGRMSANVKGFLDDVKSLRFSTVIDKNRSLRWGGDFRKKDPVHIDAPTSDKNRIRLFKENQEQLKSGKIETVKISDVTHK